MMQSNWETSSVKMITLTLGMDASMVISRKDGPVMEAMRLAKTDALRLLPLKLQRRLGILILSK